MVPESIPLNKILDVGFLLYTVSTELINRAICRILNDEATEDPEMKWEDMEKNRFDDVYGWISFAKTRGLKEGEKVRRSKRAEVFMAWSLRKVINDVLIAAETLDLPARILKQIEQLYALEHTHETDVRKPLRELEIDICKTIAARYGVRGSQAFYLGVRLAWFLCQITLAELWIEYRDKGQKYVNVRDGLKFKIVENLKEIVELCSVFSELDRIKELSEWAELIEWMKKAEIDTGKIRNFSKEILKLCSDFSEFKRIIHERYKYTELVEWVKKAEIDIGEIEKIREDSKKLGIEISEAFTTSLAYREKGSVIITPEDIDSFVRITNVSEEDISEYLPLMLDEMFVKKAIAEILRESLIPKDWGGEKSDLYTTRLRFRGKLVRAAFLLKGKSYAHTKLRIKDLGKNGDQIDRLFLEPAEIFVLQCNGAIDSSVINMLETYTRARLIDGKQTWCCILDGDNTARLLLAYGQLPIKSKDRRDIA